MFTCGDTAHCLTKDKDGHTVKIYHLSDTSFLSQNIMDWSYFDEEWAFKYESTGIWPPNI